MFVLASLNQEQVKAIQTFEYNEDVRLLAFKDITVEPALLLNC